MALVAGCAKHVNLDYTIEPQFEPYLTLFLEEGAARGVYPGTEQLSIISDPLSQIPTANVSVPSGDSLAGECYVDGNGNRTVYINQDYWASITCNANETDTEILNWCEYSKRFLIIHELGHCLLGRAHNNAITQFSDPVDGEPFLSYHYRRSIMYYVGSIDGGTKFDIANWSAYMDEMFDLSSGPN
jgi:hypothetical protein